MGKKRQIVGDLYCLRFADGKLYIGACIFGAKPRYKRHQKAVNTGGTSPLYKAWRRLGAPTLIILKQNVKEEKLWSMEKAAIIKYNTLIPNGYNYKNGSDVAPSMLGKKLTLEAKETLRKINLGKKHTEKTKKKMGVSQKQHWKDNPEKREYWSNLQHEMWKDPEKRKQASRKAIRRWKSKSAREEARNKALRQWADPQMKEKMRLAHIGSKNPGMSGKKHTEKTKRKMRKSHRERLQRKLNANNSAGCYS